MASRDQDFRGKWMFGCPYYEVPGAVDNLFFEAFEKERGGFESTSYVKKMKTIIHTSIKNGHKSRVLPHIEVNNSM